jgi:hypothetical protein
VRTEIIDIYNDFQVQSKSDIQVDLVIRGFLSAKSLIHICKIALKGQIASQNVSFYLQIQYSRSKIEAYLYNKLFDSTHVVIFVITVKSL